MRPSMWFIWFRAFTRTSRSSYFCSAGSRAPAATDSSTWAFWAVTACSLTRSRSCCSATFWRSRIAWTSRPRLSTLQRDRRPWTSTTATDSQPLEPCTSTLPMGTPTSAASASKRRLFSRRRATFRCGSRASCSLWRALCCSLSCRLRASSRACRALSSLRAPSRCSSRTLRESSAMAWSRLLAPSANSSGRSSCMHSATAIGSATSLAAPGEPLVFDFSLSAVFARSIACS
mmetsp:Transcript_113966/g.333054  ORF Transcript_113966/g.333054 Transcript_113966/m.333054 type:complete len:232 (-) Transcript_113966:270-965(-)